MAESKKPTGRSIKPKNKEFNVILLRGYQDKKITWNEDRGYYILDKGNKILYFEGYRSKTIEDLVIDDRENKGNYIYVKFACEDNWIKFTWPSRIQAVSTDDFIPLTRGYGLVKNGTWKIYDSMMKEDLKIEFSDKIEKESISVLKDGYFHIRKGFIKYKFNKEGKRVFVRKK